MLDDLRAEVLEMNLELPRNRLVVWSGGNVSGRDPESGCVVIKPSGVPFDRLTIDSMVVVAPDGSIKAGGLKPSVDLGIHLYLYAARPDVFGVTHTHSPYATSFSLNGEGIPAALTPLTHLIGGGVACTRYATPGAEDTGAAIIESVGDSGKAAIVARHGVFTLGASAGKSLEIALHVEEA
ncbi:MAG: class II aldolase/adducin family protein, partial [bacterium]|nr:class II aldolase/adducin family protein [bacterium]